MEVDGVGAAVVVVELGVCGDKADAAAAVAAAEWILCVWCCACCCHGDEINGWRCACDGDFDGASWLMLLAPGPLFPPGESSDDEGGSSGADTADAAAVPMLTLRSIGSSAVLSMLAWVALLRIGVLVIQAAAGCRCLLAADSRSRGVQGRERRCPRRPTLPSFPVPSHCDIITRPPPCRVAPPPQISCSPPSPRPADTPAPPMMEGVTYAEISPASNHTSPVSAETATKPPKSKDMGRRMKHQDSTSNSKTHR